MTIDTSENESDSKPGNRRTMSESDVRIGHGQVPKLRIELGSNSISFSGKLFSNLKRPNFGSTRKYIGQN